MSLYTEQDKELILAQVKIKMLNRALAPPPEKAVDQFDKEMDVVRRSVLRLVQANELYKKVKPIFDRHECVDKVYMDWQFWSNDVIAQMFEVKGFSEALPVIRDIRRAGYKSTGYDDDPRAKSRTYNFGRVHLIVKFADEKDEKANCKYVRTGFKTVRQATYKLVCDE